MLVSGAKQDLLDRLSEVDAAFEPGIDRLLGRASPGRFTGTQNQHQVGIDDRSDGSPGCFRIDQAFLEAQETGADLLLCGTAGEPITYSGSERTIDDECSPQHTRKAGAIEIDKPPVLDLDTDIGRLGIVWLKMPGAILRAGGDVEESTCCVAGNTGGSDHLGHRVRPGGEPGPSKKG
jgi:hypothetical protein